MYNFLQSLISVITSITSRGGIEYHSHTMSTYTMYSWSSGHVFILNFDNIYLIHLK